MEGRCLFDELTNQDSLATYLSQIGNVAMEINKAGLSASKLQAMPSISQGIEDRCFQDLEVVEAST